MSDYVDPTQMRLIFLKYLIRFCIDVQIVRIFLKAIFWGMKKSVDILENILARFKLHIAIGNRKFRICIDKTAI